LRDAGRRLGIDAYEFRNLPLSWQGARNPLVLPQARPSPSNAPKTDLPSDPRTLLDRLGNSESRRKLRRKEESLAQLGELRYCFAQDKDDVDRILMAFFRQKH
jgi:CelD/BcsL family acetyltransferase involved in cellulose biosynthesis